MKHQSNEGKKQFEKLVQIGAIVPFSLSRKIKLLAIAKNTTVSDLIRDYFQDATKKIKMEI